MIKDLKKDYIKRLNCGKNFRFACHHGVSCFTDCCHELELALTPYDTLRLRNKLGLSGQQFLEEYCIIEQVEDSPFPQVYLAMIDDGRGSCPFVKPEGCTVYEDRPGACRTYPLGRGAFLGPDGSQQNFHVLLTEPHCKGFEEPKEQTVDEWNQEQGLIEYNKVNDELMTLLHHPKAKGTHLSQKQLEDFVMTLYKLDEFATFVKGPDFKSEIDPGDAEKNDIELLLFGIRWLRHGLFGE